MFGRRFGTWHSAARLRWAGTSPSAITAARYGTTIIPAATEAVLSAVGASRRPGWPNSQADLLSVAYFHVVFTLPHELSALVLGNRELLYRLLFDSAKGTLLEVAADPKHLGARIGVLMVLHTWGQKLEHHPTFTVSCPAAGWHSTIPGMSRCSRLHLRQTKNGRNGLHLPHFYTVGREFAKSQFLTRKGQPSQRQLLLGGRMMHITLSRL